MGCQHSKVIHRIYEKKRSTGEKRLRTTGLNSLYQVFFSHQGLCDGNLRKIRNKNYNVYGMLVYFVYVAVYSLNT